ncbi:hypothetical protein TWF718_010902 [Orbilia javanica]|uniref:C2H2-type domain-containing protein n=1 Tax=Orbilia javanica TaxID=47235 RepID=A0AAN8MSX9_9PEZI
MDLAGASHIAIPPSSSGKRSRGSRHDCPVCGMQFFNQRAFGDHYRDDHNRPAFPCDICSKGFTRFDNLTIHKRSCRRAKIFEGVKDEPVSPSPFPEDTLLAGPGLQDFEGLDPTLLIQDLKMRVQILEYQAERGKFWLMYGGSLVSDFSINTAYLDPTLLIQDLKMRVKLLEGQAERGEFWLMYGGSLVSDFSINTAYLDPTLLIQDLKMRVQLLEGQAERGEFWLMYGGSLRWL